MRAIRRYELMKIFGGADALDRTSVADAERIWLVHQGRLQAEAELNEVKT